MNEEMDVKTDGAVLDEESGGYVKKAPGRRFFGRIQRRVKQASSGEGGEHRVNKVIYFLLALFLGAMGIHKFYAGRILAGIVFLAMFSVGFLLTFVFGLGMLIIVPLELIALVQGIIVLCKRTGSDGLVEA